MVHRLSLADVTRISIATLILAIIGGGFLWVGVREMTRGVMPIPGGSRGSIASSGGVTRDVTRLYGPGAILTGGCVLAIIPLAWRRDQNFARGRSRNYLLACLIGVGVGITLQIAASLVWIVVWSLPRA
jgi:hypothetical protein